MQLSMWNQKQKRLGDDCHLVLQNKEGLAVMWRSVALVAIPCGEVWDVLVALNVKVVHQT